MTSESHHEAPLSASNREEFEIEEEEKSEDVLEKSYSYIEQEQSFLSTLSSRLSGISTLSKLDTVSSDMNTRMWQNAQLFGPPPIEPVILDEAAIKELCTSHHPSYQNIRVPYSLICELRLSRKMKNVRELFKSELKKITAEQTSAFESVRIRRLYKTGMNLPGRLFMDHMKGYTFKELERLRYLMNNEVL